MKIAVATDHAGFEHLKHLKEFLESEGHELRWVSDGQSAIDAFRDDCPDLTLLDLNLPRRNGEEVLLTLRRVGQRLDQLRITLRWRGTESGSR